MAILNFDASTVEPTSTYEALPAGDYEVIVTASEDKPTKTGMGSYLELTLEVQGGQFGGRKLFDRLNLKNSNPTAVAIAQKQLSSLCHAVGVLQPRASEELHHKPLIAKVSAKLDTYNGNETVKNEIKGYKARAAASSYNRPAYAAPAVAIQAAPAAPAAAGGLPWKK